MSLYGILHELTDEAAVVAQLDACADERLLLRIRETAQQFDENAAQYASGAIRRYSNSAGNEEWLALMTALGGSDDPGRTCLISTGRCRRTPLNFATSPAVAEAQVRSLGHDELLCRVRLAGDASCGRSPSVDGAGL